MSCTNPNCECKPGTFANLNPPTKAPRLNGYVAFWKGKRTEVHASTAYEAQQKAAEYFGKRAKRWDVTVTLAELDGQSITLAADF